MADSDSESDIEINSALPQKRPKLPGSPSDDVMRNIKKTTVKMMVKDALIELKSRKGVSLYAIKKHLTEKYQVNTEKLNFLVKKTLKTGIEDGTFVQLKGVGATGSFKLANVKEKEKVKKPKKKQEKRAEPAPGKKEAIRKPKKTIEKPTEPKPKAATKKKSVEDKPSKKKVEVKTVKTAKKSTEKEKKEEKSTQGEEEVRKKTKNKMAKGVQSRTPAKKREVMMKRKSVGSIIKRPKMRPKHV